MATGHKQTPESRAKISAALKGHACSAETRAKISASKKGCKGQTWMKGLTKETDERIARMAATKTGRKTGPRPHRKGVRASIETEFKKGLVPVGGFGTRFKTGPDHPLWKGGITFKADMIRKGNEYREWRKKVYQRDLYHCRDCGVHCEAKNIVAHHLKEFADYPELRFEIENGLTLCRTCHFNRHHHKEERCKLVA